MDGDNSFMDTESDDDQCDYNIPLSIRIQRRKGEKMIQNIGDCDQLPSCSSGEKAVSFGSSDSRRLTLKKHKGVWESTSAGNLGMALDRSAHEQGSPHQQESKSDVSTSDDVSSSKARLPQPNGAKGFTVKTRDWNRISHAGEIKEGMSNSTKNNEMFDELDRPNSGGERDKSSNPADEPSVSKTVPNTVGQVASSTSVHPDKPKFVSSPHGISFGSPKSNASRLNFYTRPNRNHRNSQESSPEKRVRDNGISVSRLYGKSHRSPLKHSSTLSQSLKAGRKLFDRSPVRAGKLLPNGSSGKVDRHSFGSPLNDSVGRLSTSGNSSLSSPTFSPATDGQPSVGVHIRWDKQGKMHATPLESPKRKSFSHQQSSIKSPLGGIIKSSPLKAGLNYNMPSPTNISVRNKSPLKTSSSLDNLISEPASNSLLERSEGVSQPKYNKQLLRNSHVSAFSPVKRHLQYYSDGKRSATLKSPHTRSPMIFPSDNRGQVSAAYSSTPGQDPLSPVFGHSRLLGKSMKTSHKQSHQNVLLNDLLSDDHRDQSYDVNSYSSNVEQTTKSNGDRGQSVNSYGNSRITGKSKPSQISGSSSSAVPSSNHIESHVHRLHHGLDHSRFEQRTHEQREESWNDALSFIADDTRESTHPSRDIKNPSNDNKSLRANSAFIESSPDPNWQTSSKYKKLRSVIVPPKKAATSGYIGEGPSHVVSNSVSNDGSVNGVAFVSSSEGGTSGIMQGTSHDQSNNLNKKYSAIHKGKKLNRLFSSSSSEEEAGVDRPSHRKRKGHHRLDADRDRDLDATSKRRKTANHCPGTSSATSSSSRGKIKSERKSKASSSVISTQPSSSQNMDANPVTVIDDDDDIVILDSFDYHASLVDSYSKRRKSHKSKRTPATPSTTRVRRVEEEESLRDAVSPATLQRLNQLDEDEAMARQLQAQFDAEMAQSVQESTERAPDSQFTEAALPSMPPAPPDFSNRHEDGNLQAIGIRNIFRPNLSVEVTDGPVQVGNIHWNMGFQPASASIVNFGGGGPPTVVQSHHPIPADSRSRSRYTSNNRSRYRGGADHLGLNQLLDNLMHDLPVLDEHPVGGRRRRNGRGRNRRHGRYDPDRTPDGNDYDALLQLAEQIGPAVDKRLSQAAIDRLPTFSFCKKQKQSDDEVACPICMEDYEDGEELRRLMCFHGFHKTCIDMWLKKSQTPLCPICRVEVKIE